MGSVRKFTLLLVALVFGGAPSGAVRAADVDTEKSETIVPLPDNPSGVVRSSDVETNRTSESRGVASIAMPAAIYVSVRWIQSELELVRVEMGKPKNTQPRIALKNAAPREVYFQAQALFRKANRLSFEQTRERATEPLAPKGLIAPADVLDVVQAALSRVRHVKNRLMVKESIKEVEHDSKSTFTAIYRAIVDASRQVNLMLDRRFSPSDVFQEVTLAVGYSARLLSRFPESTRLPNAPPFERGKQPRDVYRRLTSCFQSIQTIASRSGLDVLSLETSEIDLEHVSPSDVYDIAALVVSELDYLHSRFEGLEPPRKVFYPGRKFPAHVYQRVGILEKQLEDLRRLVVESPNWMVEVEADEARGSEK